jgi:hypothetical protein
MDTNVFSNKGVWVGLDAAGEAALDPAALAAYRILRDAAAAAAAAESICDAATRRITELVAVGRDIEHQISMQPRVSFADCWRSDLQGR